MKKYLSLVCSILSIAVLSSCEGNHSITEHTESVTVDSTIETTEKTPAPICITTESVTSNESTTTSLPNKIIIGQNGFTLEIPNDFKYLGADNCYELTLQNEDKVYFGFTEWVMYTADHPGITSNELAQNLQNDLVFTFNVNNNASVQQEIFCLNPGSSENVKVNDDLFVYQSGTMHPKSNAENVFYYEAYFGVIPCIFKNSDYDIQEAPAYWYVFANSQNEETKLYVHKVMEEITASASYSD